MILYLKIKRHLKYSLLIFGASCPNKLKLTVKEQEKALNWFANTFKKVISLLKLKDLHFVSLLNHKNIYLIIVYIFDFGLFSSNVAEL